MLKLTILSSAIFILLSAIRPESEPAFIQDKPIIHQRIGKVLDTRPQDADIYGEFLSVLVNWMPFPAAIWADDETPTNREIILKSHKSWLLNLNEIKARAEDFQATYHPGFLEIAWCSRERKTALREKMVSTVPRMIFSSPYASDFLTMWHQISGINFRYDENLVQNLDAWDRKHQQSREISLTADSPYPSGDHKKFDSLGKLPLSEFMKKLASYLGGLALETPNGWSFVPFRRTPESMKIVSGLLLQAKEESGLLQQNQVEQLKRIGNAILPELLQELRNADKFYKLSLIEILAEIPSPERDAEFLKIAEDLDSWPDGWEPFDNANLKILSALAETKYLPALPLLEEYSKGSFKNADLNVNARIALNIWGRPLPAKSQDEVVTINKVDLLNSEKKRQLFPIVFSILEQGPWSYKYELAAIKEGSTGTIFKFNDKKDHESLTIRIADVNQNEAIAAVTSFYGYMAKLKKQDGRWLLINWQLVWMQ